MNDASAAATLTDVELALLRQRARALARPVAEPAQLADHGELLVTRVGAARYAVRLRELAAVVPLRRLARIPQAPGWVAGLAHEHGRVMTVVDLGALTGEAQPGALKFGLIVEEAGEPFALGVPDLEGLARDWPDASGALPAEVPEKARHLIDAIGPAGVCRLSIPRLLTDLAARTSSQGNTEP